MSRGTLDPAGVRKVSDTGLSPSPAGFPKTVLLPFLHAVCGPNPGDKSPVWALSFSLAATQEIDVSFSSSGYLDVSVHRVPSHNLWIQYRLTEGFSAGFPHSEIHGSCGYLLLTVAYRSLSRLSSALSAKASALRSF